MVDKIFLQILNMSFTASIVISCVLVVRILLRKAPKVFSYALWSVVLFRLVCPFSFESIFSLLPTKANPISQDIAYMQIPRIDTGIMSVNQSINVILPAATPQASVNPLQIWVFIGSQLWLLGVAALLGYSLVTLLRLKKRLQDASPYQDNVFTSSKIDTAFVMGIFRPKIYLPSSLKDNEQKYILLHEQTHIRRFDHIIKLVSFLVLCLHWFNPLVWIAFFLSGKDMEMSCDEAVIKRLGNNVKKDYSASLLTLATGRRIVGGTPLAFGEGDTKGRIKNVLNYNKPAVWLVFVAIIAVAFVVIGFTTNPKEGPNGWKGVRDYTKSPELQGLIDSVGSGTTDETVTAVYSIAKLGKNNEVLTEYASDTQPLADAIIMNALLKSAAWEGVDITTLKECYRIRQTFPKTNEVHDYYAYLLEDGRAVLQANRNGRYSILSNELYSQLVSSFDSPKRLFFWIKPDEPPQVIGDTAAGIWLNSFMETDTPDESRIADYKITKVTVIAGNPKQGVKWEDMAYQYVVQLTYDITTATEQYSAPGDGISGKGTFQNLSRELGVKVKSGDGGGYQIVSVGTGGAEQEFD